MGNSIRRDVEQQSNRKTPVLISVSGLIGSGKSTILKRIEKNNQKITCFLEDVENWNFLKLYYEDQNRYGLLFQLEILTRFQALRTFDFAVSERTTSDSFHIFAKMLYDGKQLKEEHWILYKDAYRVQKISPTVVLYLEIEPKEALKRIKQRDRFAENNITLEYLEKLQSYSEKWLLLLKQNGIIVHIIDGNRPELAVFHDVQKWVNFYYEKYLNCE